MKLVCLNMTKGWNYVLATCGETADLDGVEHNHCVDDRLMVILENFLGAEIIAQATLICLQNQSLWKCLWMQSFKFNTVIQKNNKDKGKCTLRL